MVDALTELAQRSAPPPLSDDRADAMVAVAMRTARRRETVRTRMRWAVAACVLLAAGLLAGTQLRSDEEPLRVQLPTGDSIVATAGAHFDVVDASQTSREVAVDRGTVLFDVKPLSPGERFAVRTRDAVVHVRGTVFSVAHEDGRTTVRVYEGSVDVARRGQPPPLRSGQMCCP